MSKNTNCLEGIRCPRCGHEDTFYVDLIIRTTVLMSDNGYDVQRMELGDSEWAGPMQCAHCEFEGTTKDFRTEEDSNA